MAQAEESPRWATIGEALRGKDNAFGVIRLTLASLVIFSHAFYIGGWGEDPSKGWTRGQETIGGFAVVGFFVVSGFLITKSGMRADLLQFMWNRTLRIFPAFLGVLVVAAAIVGPAIWWHMGRPLGDYVTTTPGGPVAYVVSNAQLEINQWGIHDIFAATNPHGGAFNGSLWTLAYEWRAYLIVAALLAVGALKRMPGAVIAATAIAYVAAASVIYWPGAASTLWPWLATKEASTLTLAFMLGGAMAVWGHRIRLIGPVAIAAGVVAMTTLFTSGWVLIGYPALAYFLLYLAAYLPPWWRRIGATNDYSYGMYVYGFLVQQVTAYFGWHRWGYAPWVAATLVITAGCAFLSWHVLEKPALDLKNRGPGKGWAYWRSRLTQHRAVAADSSL